MFESFHTHYMNLALHLAEKGRLTVSPNPMVGCVIVKDDRIVGQGYHYRCGESHAEVFALAEASHHAKDATMYINLEPCCHHGQTPPCVDSIIKSKIKKIFISVVDPNPLISGKSIELLKKSGIIVGVGLCAEQAQNLNEVFFHYIKTKRPFVLLKWAMSLDGKMSVNENDDKKISCHDSHIHMHHTRNVTDAIVVGAETARQDNPSLTVRYLKDNNLRIKQPIRIIIAGSKSLPRNLNLFDESVAVYTIIATTNRHKHKFENLISDNVKLLIVSENSQKKVSLLSLLEELGQLKITSILVEGGKTIHEDFINQNLVNKFQIYLAPKIIGGLLKKRNLNISKTIKINNDLCILGSFEEKQNV